LAAKTIATDAAPAAVGAYSQAIASDDFVFCSGQVGLDPQTGELVAGGIEEQTRRALENLGAVLAAGGASFDAVVKVTAYLIDMNEFKSFNEVYAEVLGGARPARATIGVAALPLGARVEVECIARI
jgi:2-iminobutanoate/2-iminopropanoate deaminase